jgi:purine nucleoside phosphorylase
MKLLALSMMSNMAAGITGQPITPEEVLEAARIAQPPLNALIREFVKQIDVENL